MAVSRRLSEVIDEYVDLRKQQKGVRTWTDDKLYLSRLLAHVGNIQMRHLESRHIQGFIHEPTPRGMAGLAPGSYNQILIRLRGFDRHCRDLGYVQRALVPSSMTAMRIPDKRRLRYTAPQLLEIIEAAEHARDRFFLALLCNTALRGGEATALRWKHVRDSEETIDVEVFKSSRFDRRPITSDLAAELRRWKAYYTEEVGYPQPDWYLVPAKKPFRFTRNEDGSLHYDTSLGRLSPAVRIGQPERIVQRTLAKLGHPTHQEGGHTIRRSVALIYFEQLVEAGYDDALLTVSALLNHKNVIVTQRYLGLDRHREKRDASLKGVPFLTRGTGDATVTQLRPTGVGTAG